MKTNVCLLGQSGVGKTYSVRTLAECVETFVISTDPGIERTVFDRGRNTINGKTHPEDRLHWHYIPPAAPSWTTLIDNADKINTMSNDALQKMPGINKAAYSQFFDLLASCANFTCDRCGEKFGPVDEWDDSRASVIDGMSGVSMMSLDLTIGAKPVISQPDWGVAMGNIERFIVKMCVDTKCTFVLMSHIDIERDEVTGGRTGMISTLGQKLAPKLPRWFDEIPHAYRNGKDFLWSTQSDLVSTKARALPISSSLPPSFKQLWPSEG